MNPWTQITGWTLVHFVWQGGLIALATAAALQLCRQRSSEARYAIACAGLAAMLAAPVVTAALMSARGSALAPGGTMLSANPSFDVSGTTLETVKVERSTPDDVTAGPITSVETWLPIAVWAWLGGVALFLARFAGGCWRVHRIRIASLAEAMSPWQSASEGLAAKLRLDRAFRVVESGLVDAPTVIGWIRPVILLPAAALNNLTPAQVEAILAHELTHIRRSDYAVNLLQSVAETFLFYHPGTWWVSARIRQEREHCCDDAAVVVSGEPASYAAALMELACWRSRDTALAMGATDGSLLTRVRRLLRLPHDREPRSVTGVALLTLSMFVGAGWVAVQTSPSLVSGDINASRELPVQGPRVLKTDHFDIQYEPELDLHAERVGRDAERAYEQVSSDLKHNLAFRVPVLLFLTTPDLERSVQAGTLVLPHTASVTERSRDRILFAVDRPADQWYGLLTHEVAHVFLFDIVPATSAPQWLAEGLAEYQRGAWDPADLVALRGGVRANAIPKTRVLDNEGRMLDPRLVYALGHAAFDFIESRWGKPGMRRFIFGLRQAAITGADPYPQALQVTRDEFEQGFEGYLRERFAASASGQALAERFDYRTSLRMEGEVLGIRSSAPDGLACLELWVEVEGGHKRRWAVECGDETRDVIRALKPGDRVIVTGPPARKPLAQRLVMQTLVRSADGFTWPAPSE